MTRNRSEASPPAPSRSYNNKARPFCSRLLRRERREENPPSLLSFCLSLDRLPPLRELIPNGQLCTDMPQATSEQETRHGTPLPLVHGNEAYFTNPSQVADAHFTGVELMDGRNHGWSNLDQERFHSNQGADKYWASLCFGGCAPAASEHNIDEAMWEPPFQSWPGALFSANESSVLQAAETSAMNAWSSLNPLAAQAHQTPWTQDNQMSSIQTDPLWTHDNMNVWTQFETVTSINTSDSRVCMFRNEGSLIGNELGADCYNEAWNNVTSPNTFGGGQASSLTAITGSTSSDGSSPPTTEIDTPTAQHNLAPSQPEANRRARSSKGCDDCVCFLVLNGKLASNDGYEWRKYGQKIIKGTAYPRAYFRCARKGCLVKKQVENSSDTECAVLITYFNRHNHH